MAAKKMGRPKATTATDLPEGNSVNYVTPDGKIVPALLLDVGGVSPRLAYYTEGGEPVTLSLTQIIGGAEAPYFSADQLPNTWHWPTTGD